MGAVSLLLFIALLYRQNNLALLSILVLCLGLGTKLWARASLSRVRCRLKIDKVKVFPGEKVGISVHGENAKLLPIWLSAKVRVTAPEDEPSHRKLLTAEQGLLWYAAVRFGWEITPYKRGVHHIGPLNIAGADFFGFFGKKRVTDQTQELLVYPRIVPLRQLSLQRRDFFGIPGGASPIRDPVYMLGTTDYRSGRPAKHIQWKASARHHRLQEKVFEPSELEKVLFVLDVAGFSENADNGAFERAIEVIASLALRFGARGCAVGMVTNGRLAGAGRQIIPIARNPQQLSLILEMLARVQMKPQAGLVELLSTTFRLQWGVTCLSFVYSDAVRSGSLEGYFRERRTPVMMIAAKRSLPATAKDHSAGDKSLFILDDIAITAEERT
jgi:uncharacterized protein (DUF58 family)